MENDGHLKEYMFKEIDVIQCNIKKIKINSFSKGWIIVLVSVPFLFPAFIPLLAFWYLDAYFSWLERAYRLIYDWIIENKLKTDEFLFDMKATGRLAKEVQSKLKIMISVTLLVFYDAINTSHGLIFNLKGGD